MLSLSFLIVQCLVCPIYESVQVLFCTSQNQISVPRVCDCRSRPQLLFVPSCNQSSPINSIKPIDTTSIYGLFTQLQVYNVLSLDWVLIEWLQTCPTCSLYRVLHQLRKTFAPCTTSNRKAMSSRTSPEKDYTHLPAADSSRAYLSSNLLITAASIYPLWCSMAAKVETSTSLCKV